MKKIGFILFLLIGLISLGYYYYPKSPSLEKIEIKHFSGLNEDEIIIDAEAIFENPNNFGLTIVRQDIDVYVADRYVGKINQHVSRPIAAKSSFSLPLQINFKRKEVFGGTGFLSELVKSLFDRDLNIQYKGNVDINFLGMGIPVKVDYTDNLIGGGNK